MRKSKVATFLICLTVILVSSGVLFGAGVKEDQAFPAESPVRLINPYGPGGATDISGRILAATASEFLGQSVNVVSMPGAGGQEALNFIVDDPTGYNLLITDYGPLITTALMEDVRYDLGDWVPIIQINEGHPVFFVNNDSPIKTVDDWVKMAKADPESLTVAHGRYLAPPHLPLILFEEEAKIKNTHVPTTGGSEARAFVRGGQVDMGASVTTSILPMVEAGEFRAIAVPTEERSPILPDVPTLKELGYDVVLPFWFMIFAHKDTPAEDMRTLEAAFIKAFETESAQALASKSGVALEIRGMDDALLVYQNTVKNLTTIMESIQK